ncbi:MAG: hypothetical protein R2713_15955 [Ilumatobacteraceae bacterium]
MLIEKAKVAIETGERVEFGMPIHNVNRTVGTMLGNAVTKRHGGAGLPDDTIRGSSAARPARASGRSSRRASPSSSRATPTTTSARACRVAGSSCVPTGSPRSPPRTT